MLIMSWNVAGLSTTVNRIHETYSPANQKKAPASVALHAYIQRHGADILCLQEHKIPLSQLSDRSEPCGCSTVEGYESFWSCCVDKSKQGFNGVVTYAKKGSVLRANASPLGSPDLDDQGRCVMTDHGRFVFSMSTCQPLADNHSVTR
jgi:exonuclease III